MPISASPALGGAGARARRASPATRPPAACRAGIAARPTIIFCAWRPWGKVPAAPHQSCRTSLGSSLNSIWRRPNIDAFDYHGVPPLEHGREAAGWRGTPGSTIGSCRFPPPVHDCPQRRATQECEPTHSLHSRQCPSATSAGLISTMAMVAQPGSSGAKSRIASTRLRISPCALKPDYGARLWLRRSPCS
jgi:hypothetical protein